MTLTNEAQQWNERLEAAGAIAAGLQAQVGAFEEECGQLRGTLKELQVPFGGRWCLPNAMLY